MKFEVLTEWSKYLILLLLAFTLASLFMLVSFLLSHLALYLTLPRFYFSLLPFLLIACACFDLLSWLDAEASFMAESCVLKVLAMW
jgi:hypothetical protein